MNIVIRNNLIDPELAAQIREVRRISLSPDLAFEDFPSEEAIRDAAVASLFISENSAVSVGN